MNKQRADRIQDYSWFTLMVSLVLLFFGLFLFSFNQLVLFSVFFLLVMLAIVSFFVYVVIFFYRHKMGYTRENYLQGSIPK